MRKALILAAAALLFAACGKDSPTEDSSDGEKRVEWWHRLRYEIPKDEAYTWGSLSSCKLSWENGLLKKCEDFINGNEPDRYWEAVYENGRVKEVRDYEASGEIDRTTTFIYTGNMVTGAISSDGSKITYEYNAAGDIIRMTYSDDGYEPTTTYFSWENGNLIEERRGNEAVTYTYDNKINPLRYLSIFFLRDVDPRASRNNVLSKKSTYRDGESFTSYTYTYDGDYPVSLTSSYSGDSYKGEDEFFFQYADGSGMGIPEVCHVRIGSDYPSHYIHGEGTYKKGAKVILKADQYYDNDTRYIFSHWGDGNTDNPRTFTATADVTFRPVYTADEK
ncbi:MAG: hypothetical protein J6I49_04265 [Bacteroidales bacterium]|nr:hypothetical protein [Bacteroidales bacterium]